MGRPRSRIHVGKVEVCARAMMSQADAATLLGVSLATLKRRLADDDDPVAVAWNRGQAEARRQLRAVQWTMALGGKYTIPGTDQEIVMQPDKGMAIWLGKQHLGQSDKPHAPLASDALPFERFTVKIAHPKGGGSAKTNPVAAAREIPLAFGARQIVTRLAHLGQGDKPVVPETKKGNHEYESL